MMGWALEFQALQMFKLGPQSGCGMPLRVIARSMTCCKGAFSAVRTMRSLSMPP